MRVGAQAPVRGWRFAAEKSGSRPPFSDQWIRGQIVPHLLELIGVVGQRTLNAEARDIVLMMINTGARPSELANLQPDDILLDDATPHIFINAGVRKLKTLDSERRIPLVGVSLDATRRNPQGFPRYQDKASLSAAVNKYFRANGLAETRASTLYSVRHSFEDRTLAAGFDERIRRDLMGHSLGDRQRYGAGLPLDKLADMMRAIEI